MLWDPHAPEVVPTVAPPYEIIVVAVEDVDALRDLAQFDEPMSDSAWAEFVDRLLPDGMFVARQVGTDVRNPERWARADRLHRSASGAI